MMLSSRHVLTKQARFAVRAFASGAAPNSAGSRSSSSPEEAGARNLVTLALAGILSASATAAGTVTLLEEAKHQKLPKQKYESPEPIPVHGKESHQTDYNDPPPRPDLPVIPLEEVAEHADEESMWFTFRGAVYDMTFFINGHPGGTPVSLLFLCGL